MKCINCGEGCWENVDVFRQVPKGMEMCKSCGFISYPSLWKSNEEIKEHYRKNYRNPPASNNFFTCQRKNYLHAAFLDDVFKEWKQKEIKQPSVYEVGAAYGMALQWFKGAYPGCDVGGTELTLSFRRNAFHEFGIRLDEDIDLTKKHDLIMSYKVAEHQADANLRLAEYADCLKDGGHLYVSVPTWFDSMSNFGLSGFDLEYYYSPNHINTWTRAIFENILQRAGFEIVKKDYVMYDSTYLCRVNKANMALPVFKENPREIKEKLEKIQRAFHLCGDNKVEEAIHLWPDYPNAWATKMEKDRRIMFENGWEFTKTEFIDKCLNRCTNTSTVFAFITDLCMRMKRWDDAIKYCEAGLRAAPENPTCIMHLANIMREMALASQTEDERIHYFKQARDVARHGRMISVEHFRHFMDQGYLYNAQLPMAVE